MQKITNLHFGLCFIIISSYSIYSSALSSQRSNYVTPSPNTNQSVINNTRVKSQQYPTVELEIIIYLHTKYKTTEHLWSREKLLSIPKEANILDIPNHVSLNINMHNVQDDKINTKKTHDYDKLFTVLPSSSLSLTQDKNLLENSGKYIILQHISWRQPIGADKSTSSVIDIKAESQNSPYRILGLIHIKPSDTQNYKKLSLTMQYIEITNDVTVYHAKNESTLNPDEKTTESSNSVISKNLLNNYNVFKISVKNRLLEKQEALQYFDSPVLSILMKITPYVSLK